MLHREAKYSFQRILDNVEQVLVLLMLTTGFALHQLDAPPARMMPLEEVLPASYPHLRP